VSAIENSLKESEKKKMNCLKEGLYWRGEHPMLREREAIDRISDKRCRRQHHAQGSILYSLGERKRGHGRKKKKKKHPKQGGQKKKKPSGQKNARPKVQ